MYEILSSKEFFERYEKLVVPGEFKFITKAFRQSDNTIAIFEKENQVDCYFQLPGWKSNKVPENRKWVYKLAKGQTTSGGYLEMEDGRYKIPVDALEIWENPYEDVVSFESNSELEEELPVEIKGKSEGFLEKLDRLEAEVARRIDKIEYAKKKLSEMENKILETLKKFDYED